ncbi:MAG TPA: M48 family metalloprotease, partial [Gemmatimonadaceae bacterium]|nr:M48 family metalloprotease [Gemmatimonadaceae bacterium]
MSLHPSWLALVALVPAAATWWTGRRLLRRLDDPALPELLLQRRSRIGALWGLTLFAILVLDARQAAWAIPLMLVAMLVADYPAQRVLLDERWSLRAYLWHSLRRLAGGIAMWVVLVVAPSVVLGARDTRTATLLAAGFAATLLLWLHHYRRIWLWTHGATPLGARPGLDERFAAVMAKATTTPPLLYRFGQPGERRAAAFALPSAGHTGAVVFSDALLELLTADEVAAVFAHEVAHLEQHTPRRMRRLRIVSSLLIVAILALSLEGQRWAPGAHPFLSLGCGVAVVVALSVRASRSKRHETESDLRGA